MEGWQLVGGTSRLMEEAGKPAYLPFLWKQSKTSYPKTLAMRISLAILARLIRLKMFQVTQYHFYNLKRINTLRYDRKKTKRYQSRKL